MKENINMAQPMIGKAEKSAVLDVLESGIVAQGPVVKELEQKFADYCGTKYAVAVNSGTAALHTALHSVGIKENDTVITTPFTFIASVNSILMSGAKPKFVDIEYDTFNIDASKIEDAIDETTRAIIPVDLYGQLADYDAINDIAGENNLSVIEDSCQAIGAEMNDGKKAGSFGSAGCFSLYATKNIMSGEGGVITTDDESVVEKSKSFRQHGMDMNSEYQYAELGYNYRTTDILAAIALTQLMKTDELNNKRISNAEILTEDLKDIPGLIVPRVLQDRKSVFHQYTIRITDNFSLNRSEFMTKLKENKISSAIFYPRPIHTYPYLSDLGYSEGDFPVSEQASQEVVSLPVHPGLNKDNVDYVVETIRKISNA